MSLMKWLRRLWCKHPAWKGTVLPEEEFGLYAFSRMECIRCGYADSWFRPRT